MRAFWAVGRVWHLLPLRVGRAGRARPAPDPRWDPAPTGDHLDAADERRAAIGDAWWTGDP